MGLRDENPGDGLRRLLLGLNRFALGLLLLLVLILVVSVVNTGFGLDLRTRRGTFPNRWSECLTIFWIALGWGGLVGLVNLVPPIRRFCWRNPLAVLVLVFLTAATILVLFLAFVQAEAAKSHLF